VRESGGAALAVSDAQIEAARDLCGRGDGLLLCPEGAATLAAAKRAIEDRLIERDARVMLFNCGSGLKYPLPDRSRFIDRSQAVTAASLS
jgi:threonine synthase